ncbi:MAG: L-serine ammonia-lyase, iron-sulfur-dependent, subunit alpha [Erysipelotrichaceae bacterium]|nr:L-serine ammonia-lyase, iron-sulfur-dependent, subunit alpha [Erysipelotrichaceae bacterium]
MQAIKELYKAGRGPSSSHTLAPERACRLFTETFGEFPYYEAELFGSLSLTGKGHYTDRIIMESLPGECNVKFSLDWEEDFPNGFYLTSFNENHEMQHRWTVFSIGGGSIQIKEMPLDWNDEVYHEKSYREIRQLMKDQHISLLDYVYSHEPDLRPYLNHIIDVMIECVDRGITTDGILPGRLHMNRTAHQLYAQSTESLLENNDLRLMAYAFAAGEENAAGHTCVTAPTLGACGVMTALVYYCAKDRNMNRQRLCNALAIGGVFGNLIKSNATISGAVGGCQAEVGTAVSMAAASAAYLMGQDIDQIEYAAEIAMEHNLGLTCDPVMGYVMIPCIERNAMGVLRALDAATLSRYMSKVRKHLVSFDMVVETMKQTGMQIPIELRETAEGGLAREFLNEN